MNENNGVNRTKLYQLALFPMNNGATNVYFVLILSYIATFGNKEQSMMGQNYLRSLFAVGFQGFLIMVCVGIYAVLITSVTFSTDIVGSLWGVLGYTILLCFTLFKTGSITKSVFHAH